jgi:hypothetical protein
MNDRQGVAKPHRRTHELVWSWVLPKTADDSRGSENLSTRPRAGNISTDTRAGKAG